MKTVIAAVAATLIAGSAMAAGHCAAGKTLTEGKLTIATGNPAYYPWVLNDAPEAGEGFEAAVAYALAEEMGFAAEDVTWTRTSFDQAIQPGPKDFDLNMQQFSITAERDKVVDFSAPYYTAPQAVLTTQDIFVAGGTSATMAFLKEVQWGVVASTTALPVVMEQIQPTKSPLVYDDNANVIAAMQAGQIDAALFDLPTALFTSAVLMDNGAILGQFDPAAAENPDQFGALMPEGSALKACVDEALDALKADGSLAAIEAEWLQEATGVPLIK
ncbi:ABC transporter substrate-binding protein [uncultured Tateyamaria sp.]|uniref:ABC transporter substrate-binding protein n=1 Tax=uncultured Tateyamaria sp. TaxID=455651 RepID=UPI002613CC78|nr:ABC transporter substrate-binding protein [uncultured Tateyamaria sp.]